MRPRAFMLHLLFAVLGAGCGSRDERRAFDSVTPTDDGSDAAAPAPPSGSFGPSEGHDAGPPDPRANCPALPPRGALNQAITIAPGHADYEIYELGPVPGTPPQAKLGGTVLLAGTTDTLLVGVDSEYASGAIYKVKITRDACNHIVGYDGIATRVADAPYVDATLLYGPNGILLFPMWNTGAINRVGQLLPGATTPIVTNTAAIGIAGGGPSSAGFVPPSIPAAKDELRLLTHNPATNDGYWYHVPYAGNGPSGSLALLQSTYKATLPNRPGGFAYIPAGSPGFTAQSLIVAEWGHASVATYDVDALGDPIPSTRAPFITGFPGPWGAYFEPVAGDFLFLTWGRQTDSLFVVVGFEKPPAPPVPK